MKLLLLLLLGLFLISCGSSDRSSYAAHVAQQRTHPTSAGRMSYLDQGAGKTIVLLHGVPTSSWVYRKVIPGLAKNHRVIAVDLIGYGSSAKPQSSGSVYSPEAQAHRVQSLMKSLKIPRYSVMMHDMGGLVAWEMMRQERSAIENLIVLNTIVREEGFNPPEMKPGFVTGLMTKAYANRWTSEIALGMTFRNLGLGSNHSLNEDECYGYVKPMQDGADRALYSFFTSLNRGLYAQLERNKPLFRSFKGRTLILWGGKDKTLTTEQIPFLTKNLRVPEQNVKVYPRNNHFLTEEIPSEVVQQVTRFLK